MSRERPTVHAYSADGPILHAILDVLHDVYDLLDGHIPQPGGGEGGLVRLTEPARPAPVVAPAPEPAQADVVAAPPTFRPPAPPPLAGKGSSRTAWAAWAATAGTPVDDGMSRDDIITACRDAGVLD